MLKNLKNQNGQSAMEYVILTALIGIVCLASFQKFGKDIDSKVKEVNKIFSKRTNIKGQ
ncbi:MAG: Flp family type IVb pilin [Bacteriovoracaceae bacterium]|jgi:Flp pilus assembly pilin Flp|nr:Flp family type IVb pilin [Bacteriovoracaceae bacterium]